ncbi:MAG: DNA repair protein RadA [Elusimicrobia bacterium]|nr:DNA repair protein RadA [Elusimicrobiota bacterium]
MPRLKSIHRCQECGFSSPKWLGQCPGCQGWNTLVEEVVEVRPASSPGKGAAGARLLTDFSSGLKRLSEIDEAGEQRIQIGLGELDRLIGGGLMKGQVMLLAGPPGIGKSTITLQAAASLAAKGRKVLYASGEESLAQVSARARRLGVKADNLLLASETDLHKVLDALREVEPDVLVLDSIQTVYHPDLVGSPGSVGQVRECAAELLRAAKSRGTIVLLLGHVTKEGSLAGPRVLEHIVDTVLSFDTEDQGLLRVLRVPKNRFGPSDEIALFEMAEQGLREVKDASAYFLSERTGRSLPGRAGCVALEGSRPVLVEVQALVVHTKYPLPRRMATGLDLNRTLVLLAALEKHLHLRLETRDVFVSLAGGLKPKDPALDLAVCMAVVSSARDAALPADRVYLGEVGLLGNIQRAPFIPQRLKEAEKMGFSGALVPQAALKDLRAAGLTIDGAADIVAAVARELGGNTSEGPAENYPEEDPQ